MTGRPGSRRLAVPALLLALLVPARAIALCCLHVAPAGAHTTHGPVSHHRAGAEPAPVGPALGLASESACVGLTTSAPALRERGRWGETAPEAGDPASVPIDQVRDFAPPACVVPRSLTPVSLTGGVEDIHPLRL